MNYCDCYTLTQQQGNYSIICLFRIAVGPDEKFGLDRVQITEGFCLGNEIKGRCILTNFNDLGTLDHLFSVHIEIIDEL